MNRSFRAKDLSGQSFGRLVAWWPAGKRGSSKYGRVMWLCCCVCGNLKVVAAGCLTGGVTGSCGCLEKENLAAISQLNLRHGHSRIGQRTLEYRSWKSMNNRCNGNDPRRRTYHDYKIKGVSVCERWQGERGFENFLADMGPRPKNKTLDRYPDPYGNYEPGNCRWATNEEQSNNRRNSHMLTLDGVTMSRSQWARKVGMSYWTLRSRLERGWNLREAITGDSSLKEQIVSVS
jgi:hypothetical protein